MTFFCIESLDGGPFKIAEFVAHDPATLKRTWQSLKEIMAPGALDAVTKEMVYLAVSVTNGCAYCIASHGAAARKAGMSEAMFGELMAVVGMAIIWKDGDKKNLSYCVSNASADAGGFGNRYNTVVSAMADATKAWEAVADIKYIHVTAEDSNCTPTNRNVKFDVRPVNLNAYLARAFFPDEDRTARNVLIDNSAFELPAGGKLSLTGILRHELGHTIGARHEHTRPQSGTCFEDKDWRGVTDYDALSVMHYPQCNGKGDWSLTLTLQDKNGVACLYKAAPGFTIDPNICKPK